MFTLVVSVFILALIYLFVYQSRKSNNIPPVPVKPYPILGHLTMLKKNGPRKMINKWKDETGNIYSIYMGNKLVVVLSGYDLLKEALVKQAGSFSDRPVPITAHKFPDKIEGIIFANGETWKEQRSVSMSILRDLGMGKNCLAEKISDEVDQYLNALGEFNGEPANVRMLTSNCMSNVICSIIIGKRFEFDDPEFVHLLEGLHEDMILSANTGILNFFPFLRYLPGDLFHWKKLTNNYITVRTYLAELFVKPAVENPDTVEHENFVTKYVKERKLRIEQGKSTTMNEVNLIRNIQNLFVAGTETTSSTILWFIVYMLQNPDVLTKIHEEIVDVVGNERVPSMYDKSKLNYLNATIMETQRKSSIAPFSISHLCNKTTILEGYTIPKGTIIMPNLDSVLSDQKVWGDPHNFRPERFLDNEGSLKSFKEFVPFSLGKRVCMGESLAKMELFLFISAICQHYDIRPAEEGKPPSSNSVYGITAPPQPFKARFIVRNR